MATVRNMIGNGRDAGGVSNAANASANLQTDRKDMHKAGKVYAHANDGTANKQKVATLFKNLRKVALARQQHGLLKDSDRKAGVKSSHDQHAPRQGKGSDRALSPANTASRNAGKTVGMAASHVKPHYSFAAPPKQGTGNGQARKNPGVSKGMQYAPHVGLTKGKPVAPFSQALNHGTARFQGKGNGQRMPHPGTPKGMRKPVNEAPSMFKGAAPGAPKTGM